MVCGGHLIFGLGWSRLYRTLIESERDKRKGEGL